MASHATSKIGDADDLFRVRTLGFRGEALASIAEVSRLLIRSRTADAPAGAELEVSGGRMGEVRPCGCPVGTTIEVRNLFFNTPVRRKFLRTTQTEIGHTIEAFTRIALAYPTGTSRCGTTTASCTICRPSTDGSSGSPRFSATSWATA